MRIYFLYTVALFLLVLPNAADASPVVRSGDVISVTDDQVVEGDFYAAAGSISLSGPVHGDVYVVGGTVTINAQVDSDVAILGGTTQVHAPIGDDLRIAGGKVTLASEVSGDVVVLGGELEVLSTATIKGDLIIAAAEVIVEGGVDGSIFGFADSIRIDASIGGDVHVASERGLTLGDRAEVLGDIVYKSNSELVRAQGAVVVGNIQEEKPVTESSRSFEAIAILLITTLFASLTAYLVLKQRLQRFVMQIQVSYGTFGLVGLGVLIGGPVLLSVLFASVIGIFVGVVLLALYIALLVSAWIVAGIACGALLMKLLTNQLNVSFTTVVLGTLVLQVVIFIPYVGPLLGFAALLIALGALSTGAYKMLS